MDNTKPTQPNLLEQIIYYWNALVRWKWTCLTVAFLILMITGAIVLIFPHIYSARGTIWIDEASSILPFEDLNRISGEINAQSHSLLLTSRSLANEVIEKLKLYENPEFVKINKNKESKVPADPRSREKLIDSFIKSLNVSPISGTKLIEVTFNHTDPELAARILNTLFDSYIEMLIKRKYLASEQATEFLTTQMASLRKEIEENEKKLSELGTQQGILPLSSAEAPLISRITEVNTALTAATLDRINKLSAYNQLRSLPAEEIPETAANTAISRLKEQYVLLSREYARRLATLKPEYPEMQKLKSEIEATYDALRNEKENLIKSAYADYQVALNKELNLQKLLDDLKNQAYKANSSAILYNSLKIETDQKKALLEALSKRQSETDLTSRLKDLQAINVWIVDKASPPVNPSFPNRRKTMLIGFLLAVLGGTGSGLFVNYLVATIKSSRDVWLAVGWPTIGTIPSFEKEVKPQGPLSEFRRLANLLRGRPGLHSHKKQEAPREIKKEKKENLEIEPLVYGKDQPVKKEKKEKPGANQIELILINEPHSIQAEAYRSLRTTLMLSLLESGKKSLVLTSPLTKEGKSATISNLGLALSQAHKKVVIVDSDLRKPKQNKILEVDYIWGLTHFLSSIVDASEIILPTKYSNLYLVPSGTSPADPLEALFSDKMKAFISYLKQQFDYVLLDSAPLLAVSDALLLGKLVDGVILVIRGGQTPVSALKQVRQKMEAHHLDCLGVIINGVSLVEQDGYYARQYYSYAKPL
jgi:capsular exopolysaccharide synthesis family protein